MSYITTTVHFTLDGKAAQVPPGTSVAAALRLCSSGLARVSVTGELRAPLCGMGICQECRLTIDGQSQLSCQTLCATGMVVESGTWHPPC